MTKCQFGNPSTISLHRLASCSPAGKDVAPAPFIVKQDFKLSNADT